MMDDKSQTLILISAIALAASNGYLFSEINHLKQDIERLSLTGSLEVTTDSLATTHPPISESPPPQGNTPELNNVDKLMFENNTGASVVTQATEASPVTSTALENNVQNAQPSDVMQSIRSSVFGDEANDAPENRLQSTLETDYALAKPYIDGEKMIYGNLDARISIVMYSDIECPFCKRMKPNIKAVVDHSQGVINWEYRHYPLSFHEPAATEGALVLECAAQRHGNRAAWYALDLLAQNTAGGGKGFGDTSWFSEAGFDSEAIAQCVTEQRFVEKIKAQHQEGISLGITSTPSMVLYDHMTGKRSLLKGYNTANKLAEAIYQFLQ